MQPGKVVEHLARPNLNPEMTRAMATTTLTTGRARAPKSRRATPAPAPAPTMPMPWPRDPAPLPVAAMGQRINELCDEFNRLDREGRPSRYRADRAESERFALLDLALLRPAQTVADVAVQASCAYVRGEGLAEDDRLSPELRACAVQMRRAFASIAIAACRETGADPARVAFGDMLLVHAREFGANVLPPVAADPDTGLIAMCREFISVEQRDRAAFLTHGEAYDDTPEHKHVNEWLHDRHELIADMPARTLEGMKLKARVAIQLAPRTFEGGLLNVDGWADSVAWGLLADLAGGTDYLTDGTALTTEALVPPVVADPDAALIEACDEAINLDREWCRRINAPASTHEEEERVEIEAEPLKVRCRELVERARTIVPTTREGERALAQLAVQLANGAPISSLHDHLAWHLLRVIAGQDEPAADVVPANVAEAA